MILINLLPHREAARKRKRDVFNVSLGFAALIGGVIAGAIFLWYQNTISEQQSTNLILQTEIKRLETQIKDIEGLEAENATLRDAVRRLGGSLPDHAGLSTSETRRKVTDIALKGILTNAKYMRVCM